MPLDEGGYQGAWTKMLISQDATKIHLSHKHCKDSTEAERYQGLSMIALFRFASTKVQQKSACINYAKMYYEIKHGRERC